MSRGSNFTVTWKCSKGHISEWRSQPKIKDGMSAGSLLLSSATLFTGIRTPGLKNLWKLPIYIFSLEQHL